MGRPPVADASKYQHCLSWRAKKRAKVFNKRFGKIRRGSGCMVRCARLEQVMSFFSPTLGALRGTFPRASCHVRRRATIFPPYATSKSSTKRPYTRETQAPSQVLKKLRLQATETPGHCVTNRQKGNKQVFFFFNKCLERRSLASQRPAKATPSRSREGRGGTGHARQRRTRCTWKWRWLTEADEPPLLNPNRNPGSLLNASAKSIATASA